MQNVDLRVDFRIADHFVHQFFAHFPSGIAQLRVHTYVFEKLSLPVDLREIGTNIFGNFFRFMPARGRDSEAFARPTVPHSVKNQPAFFNLSHYVFMDLLRTRSVERLGRKQRVILVPIPALIKLVAAAKLHEITVQSRFGHPVD